MVCQSSGNHAIAHTTITNHSAQPNTSCSGLDRETLAKSLDGGNYKLLNQRFTQTALHKADAQVSKLWKDVQATSWDLWMGGEEGIIGWLRSGLVGDQFSGRWLRK